MGMGDRAFASATELSDEIRDQHIGCFELLDFYLARAERHNPALNAIVVWQVDQARERARAADAALARGERWGPLHGIPMTVKESFNVAGLPTTFGNPLWKDNIATGNAFMIDRLLQAGAIIFGKTNVPYMLADAQSYNDIYGTTNNPWDPTRSSGGEAATLAAGLSALGAGSDHRRLIAQPGALQRRLWSQTDLGADLDARPRAAGHLDADRHIRGRPHGAPRRGPRSGAARSCRTRPVAADRLAGRVAAAAPAV